MTIDFSVVVVTYNSGTDISNLLSDFKKISSKILKNTIVIDNNSSDYTVDVIKNDFSEVQLVTNKTNVGYGAAVNQGFTLAKHEAVFLMNPDIRITEKDFFSNLLAVFSEKEAAAVGPLQQTQLQDKSSLTFTWSFLTPRSMRWFITRRKNQPIFKVRFLNFGCLLLRKSEFEAIGGIDGRYFMYGEEPHVFFYFWSLRKKVYLHTGVTAVHFREKSVDTLSLRKLIQVRWMMNANVIDASARGIARVVRSYFRK